MNSFSLTDIPDKVQFSADVLLDDKFLLLPPASEFSSKMKQALIEWEFKQVLSDGNPEEAKAAQPAVSAVNAAAARKSINSEMTDVSAEFADEAKNEEAAEESPESLYMSPSDGSETVMQRALRLVEEAGTEKNTSIEKNQLNLVQTVYDEYLKYILDVYTFYATNKKLSYDEIANAIRDLCVFINDHRRYMLRIQSSLQADKRMYLINHAMRTTVLSIAIAIQLRMPLPKQVELGVSCLLHEIGMLKLPPQIYITDKQLTAQERNSIYTHPLFSYNILKEHNFPLSVCLGALEHHERENGMGYPRRLSGEKISVYAKIISVACSYESITSSRAYKEAHSSFEAMVEILKNNGKQYDENIIKAFLFAVSLYPIGAYVFLHNGKIGQVVDVNPLNPKQPVVQFFNEKDEHGEPVTAQIGAELRIVRTLSRQEVEDLQKSVKK